MPLRGLTRLHNMPFQKLPDVETVPIANDLSMGTTPGTFRNNRTQERDREKGGWVPVSKVIPKE